MNTEVFGSILSQALSWIDHGGKNKVETRELAMRLAYWTGRTLPTARIDPSLDALAVASNRRGREQLQRILGYLGLFQQAVHIYRVSLSVDQRPKLIRARDTSPQTQSSRLRELVRDQNPTIIGNSADADPLIPDLSRPIVRLNIVLPHEGPAFPTPDLVFLNSEQLHLFEKAIHRRQSWTLRYTAGSCLFSVAGKPRLLGHDRLVPRLSAAEIAYAVPMTGIQAIADLLSAGSRSVHIVAMDFYLTDLLKKSRREMCAQLGNAVIWGQLDWVQSLYRRGLVTADAAGRAVLEMSLEEYAEKLETLYSDWSNEITNV